MSTSVAIDIGLSDNDLKIREYPQLIKYMGSKAKIINFVSESIESVYDGGGVCDLFAGACSLSGALGKSYLIHSNDIQNYSAIISSVYLNPIENIDVEKLIQDATINYKKARVNISDNLEYSGFSTLKEFNKIENNNRKLINESFRNHYHLFLKNYSGTWWSAEQCLWIDAIKQSIDKRVKRSEWGDAEYAFSMAILLHAMTYSSQGTGHFSQYRDAKTKSSMQDINIYRQKKLQNLFVRKFIQIQKWAEDNVEDQDHTTSTEDYKGRGKNSLSNFEPIEL